MVILEGQKNFWELSYKFFIDWQVGGRVSLSLSVYTQMAGLIWQMKMEIGKTSPPELSATCTCIRHMYMRVYMYFKCILYLQEAKSYPVQWIKVVEKLDEAAFSRKHMFQIVIVPVGPSSNFSSAEILLYLQAAVRERERERERERAMC